MKYPEPEIYQPQNAIRIVTSTSLFDGHDASINIMRRILQSSGAEIIHLGHNRSAAEIVDCAIQEDVQGIAITSYQGGHIEFFKYVYDLLNEAGCGHIRIFGGGGGTILPSEIEDLQAYGISRIYSPDDGRSMGLQGMINDLLRRCDYSLLTVKSNAHADNDIEEKVDEQEVYELLNQARQFDFKSIARLISIAELDPDGSKIISSALADADNEKVPVLGITGTGGSGKSSLIDELARRYMLANPGGKLAVISIDPSRRRSGGALLGDRIRMNSIHNPNIYMRSMATRQSNLSLSKYVKEALEIVKSCGFDLVIIETSGIGQSDTQIVEHSDAALYVMTPEYGASTQLEKIDMLDFADVVAINKFDKKGSLDALRDVRKQYRRNRLIWDGQDEALPVVGTRASQFNDEGMDRLYEVVMDALTKKKQVGLNATLPQTQKVKNQVIIAPDRVGYLAEIVDNHRRYNELVRKETALATQLFQIEGAISALKDNADTKGLEEKAAQIRKAISANSLDLIDTWELTKAKYAGDTFEYKVRDKVISLPLTSKTLSGTRISKVMLPKYANYGDVLSWLLKENVPGEFPYTSGVFPLKRQGEDPTRMFAGEGCAERTNRRFHYVSKGLPAKRLSTAFDSVTLYGEDPAIRPDIYGKIGNSGVSISTLDDAKKLYSGFDLTSASTSVSMTINGPAPIVLAFFLNAAIDQQCERYLNEKGQLDKSKQDIEDKYKQAQLKSPHYFGEIPSNNDQVGLGLLGVSGNAYVPADVYQAIKAKTLSVVRGTVQADILKEDQAQNTCIYSTEFALKMMGDVQEYFINHNVTNFYSVSISGYHIAEAGANPVTQLALTLANGFTYVEYYLSRGLNIDDFAPNLSFFFSNGVDIEYSVIGRVARRVWAKAIKNTYGGNDRSQKLKYHIQTSGRSLHSQEIAFNDIRTTLQALYAIYDNCNSLHTNAYDEAITTPTEESVRRAMAIQLIINHEYGMSLCENPNQGSFIIEELTDLVEEAVMEEFKRISDRGGVLGAMERMYQRNKIQDESLHYETLKHNGDLKLIGVNTFLDENGSPLALPTEVIRSTEEERNHSIEANKTFQKFNVGQTESELTRLKEVAVSGENIFDCLMETVKYCTLGQISSALYEVGGQYRRNM